MTPYTYVFQGQRIAVGDKRCVSVGLIDDSGRIIESRLYPYKKDMHKAIGWTYVGAEFTETQAKDLGHAKMSKRWPNKAQVVEWEAKDFAAKADLARFKNEADARKNSEIDRQLSPLRRTYNDLMNRGDHTGCDALERTVLSALRRRLRSDE